MVKLLASLANLPQLVSVMISVGWSAEKTKEDGWKLALL